jgi:hypothetical protein
MAQIKVLNSLATAVMVAPDRTSSILLGALNDTFERQMTETLNGLHLQFMCGPFPERQDNQEQAL